MSIPMKILLENKDRYGGTVVSYPYNRENGDFEVQICNKSKEVCCVVYSAKGTDFIGEKERKEIKRICKENRIRHRFHSSGKKLLLQMAPTTKNTHYIISEIDEVLGLPTEELDETKL